MSTDFNDNKLNFIFFNLGRLLNISFEDLFLFNIDERRDLLNKNEELIKTILSSKIINFTKSKLPFGEFGNMSAFPVVHLGVEFRTTEALFQSLRFDNKEIISKIINEKSPMGAKFVAKANSELMIIEPQSLADIKNMKLCVKLKLEQHPKVLELLRQTADAIIVEDVSNRGPKGSNLFWGALNKDGSWEGSNVLGNILMEFR